MKFDNYQVTEIHNDTVVIEFTIGNWCNFRCPYCFDDSNTGTHLPPKVNDILINNVNHMIKEIRSMYPTKHIRWTLSGGEPTAQKGFAKLLQALSTADNNSHVMLITNGTRPIAWWEENVQYVPHVILSVHPESNTEHNIKLAKVLSKNNVIGSINVMVGSQNFDQAVASFKALVLEYWNYSTLNIQFNRIRKTSRNDKFVNLSDDQHLILNRLIGDYRSNRRKCSTWVHVWRKRKLTFPMPIQKLSYEDKFFEYTERFDWFTRTRRFEGNWMGYKCLAPSMYLCIEQDGTVDNLPCGANFSKKLYNFFSEDFLNWTIFKDPIICDKLFKDCNCVGLLEAPKYIDKY